MPFQYTLLRKKSLCQLFRCLDSNGFKLKRKLGTLGKLFIMSAEVNKNISDSSHSCTDQKNGFEFFMRFVKWPKIDVKKCQNPIFKVDFQCPKSSESF